METEELASVFIEIFELMRPEGRDAVEAFARSYRSQLGGQIAILGPCRSAHRPLSEAGYRSERFDEINT